jgi:hypothetical protein
MISMPRGSGCHALAGKKDAHCNGVVIRGKRGAPWAPYQAPGRLIKGAAADGVAWPEKKTQLFQRNCS